MCSFIDYPVLKMRFISYVLLLPSNEMKSYDHLIRVDLDTAGESQRDRFPVARKAPTSSPDNQQEWNSLEVQVFSVFANIIYEEHSKGGRSTRHIHALGPR